MRFPALTLTACLLLVPSLLFIGCGKMEEAKDAKTTAGPIEISEDPPAPPPGGEHDHPDEGPHKGRIVELGDEAYHAELLDPEHGEKEAVTIYILDSSAAKQVPIDAADVTINLQHEGKPEQFKLDAAPDKDDPDGKSSRFTSNNAELLKHFGEGEIKGRLVVKINGKQFNGDISHSH